jgi:hypothetical protein
MTWAVPTQPPARPQTVTPGSTRGPTQKTVIARRETQLHPLETGRSPTQTPSGRSRGRVCPLVHSLGAASRCKPLVSNLGNRSRNPPPIPAPKLRMKGYQPTVSTVGSPTPNQPPTESVAARPEGRRPLASRSPRFQPGDSVPPRLQLWKTHAPSQGEATPKTHPGPGRPGPPRESKTSRSPIVRR